VNNDYKEVISDKKSYAFISTQAFKSR